MRKIFVCIGFLLLGFNSLAQDDVDWQIVVLEDSIQAKIEQYGEKHENVVKAYLDLVVVLKKNAKYDEAQKTAKNCLNICLDICSEISDENHSSTVRAYNNLELVYAYTGQYNSKADSIRQKNIPIKIGVLRDSIEVMTERYNKNKTHIYSTISHQPVSSKYNINKLRKLKNILEQEYLEIGAMHSSLATSYLKIKNYHKALESFKKALHIKTKVVRENDPSMAILYYKLSSFYSDLNHSEKGYYYYRKYINAWKSKHKSYHRKKKNRRYTKKDAAYATENSIVNKNYYDFDTRIDERRLIRNLQGDEIDSIRLQLNIVQRKKAKAELLTKEELKQKGWQLDSIYLMEAECLNKIFAFTKMHNPNTKANWIILQNKLLPNEALLSYFRFYDFADSVWVYKVMLIKKDEPEPLYIRLGATESVNEMLSLKNHLPYYLQYKEGRKEMYSLIWDNVEEYLKNIKIVHVISEASLNKIDFESLQNEKDLYLADLYHFHYYTSSRLFLKKTQGKQQFSDATLYGHIPYFRNHKDLYRAMADSLTSRIIGDSVNILPNTLEEVTVIDSICTKNGIASILLTIDSADESKIEYYTRTRAPCLIHIATHGTYLSFKPKDGSSLRSGKERFQSGNSLQRAVLLLSNGGEAWLNDSNAMSEWDGVLTAREVSLLDLEGTKLVVLSSCNSGIGNGTEFGFPQAFKLAGVDKILVSLWPVEDETTKELMILFYSNLLQHKQDAATALRNAKAEMRKRDDRPKKWAGFVLVE